MFEFVVAAAFASRFFWTPFRFNPLNPLNPLNLTFMVMRRRFPSINACHARYFLLGDIIYYVSRVVIRVIPQVGGLQGGHKEPRRGNEYYY